MENGSLHALAEPTRAGDVVIWVYRRRIDEAKPSVVDLLAGGREFRAFSLSRNSLRIMSTMSAPQEFYCGEILTVKV
jgi:hypothetical protein